MTDGMKEHKAWLNEHYGDIVKIETEFSRMKSELTEAKATIAKQAERIEVESVRSDRFAAALSQVRADIMKGATNVIWTGVPPNETVVDYVTRTLGDNFDHDEVYAALNTDSEGG